MKIRETILYQMRKLKKKGFKAIHTLESGIQELKEYYLSGNNIYKNY